MSKEKVIDFSWKDTRSPFQKFCEDMYHSAMSERRAYGETTIDLEEYLLTNRDFLLRKFNEALQDGEDWNNGRTYFNDAKNQS